MFESVINQIYDRMIDEAEAGVLNSSHKIYVSDNFLKFPMVDKYDLPAGGSMSVAPPRF